MRTPKTPLRGSGDVTTVLSMAAMNDPISRALLALDGLSVGDAFGQCFFSPHEVITSDRIARNDAPAEQNASSPIIREQEVR